MIVTPDMLKLLELVVADKADEIRRRYRCSRCDRDARPRRLWNCRGTLLVYKAVCIKCVQWVGERWMEYFEIMAMREWARDLGERRTG